MRYFSSVQFELIADDRAKAEKRMNDIFSAILDNYSLDDVIDDICWDGYLEEDQSE